MRERPNPKSETMRDYNLKLTKGKCYLVFKSKGSRGQQIETPMPSQPPPWRPRSEEIFWAK